MQSFTIMRSVLIQGVRMQIGLRCSVLTTAALLLATSCGAVSRAADNEPAKVADNLLRGAIDFHVHSGPDLFTRSVLDFEIARVAQRQGMRALVLKNHFTMTADRAVLAERLSGLTCFGGIVLNRAVGGINANAIERMVHFAGKRGKVVWLPTFDAENHVRRFEEQRPFVSVIRSGQPVPELTAVLKLIAKHRLVLCTGHSSADECLLLIQAARKAGVDKILVTHAMADPIRMTIPQLKQAAALGAKLECVWLSNLQGKQSHLPGMRSWLHVSTADYARAIRAVGVEHFVLSSDLGQYLNPLHTDGIKAFLLELSARGFTPAELSVMSRHNAAALLDLPRSDGS